MPATLTTTTHPTTYYPERTLSTGETFAAGFYTDHTDPEVRRVAFEMRRADLDRSMPDIAEAMNLQCWQHAGMAARAHATATGQAMPRRYRRTSSSRRTNGRYLLNRRFGIELETARGTMRTCWEDRIADHRPVHAAAEAMRDQGLDAHPEAYNHSTRNHWKVTYDCTVTGVEAVSPILRGDDGYAELLAATRGLKAAGANPGGGIHVHHDCTDLDQDDLANVATNLRHAQHAVASFVTARRQRSSWCPLISDYSFDRIDTAIANGSLFITDASRVSSSGWSCPTSRYAFFNFTSLGKYGTIEFRGHGASLNAPKLRTWIAVGQAIIEAARLGHVFTERQSVRSMLDSLVGWNVLTQDAADRFSRRAAQVHGDHILDAR